MIIPKGYFQGDLFLDEQRLLERAYLYFNNDLSQVIDFSRFCIQTDTVQQIKSILNLLDDPKANHGGTLYKVVNRFAVPSSPQGIRDLKWYVTLPEANNRRICYRVVASALYEPQLLTMSGTAKIAADFAVTTLRNLEVDSYFAVIIDNFLPDDPTSMYVVYGFDSLHNAKHYAIHRFRQRIYQLKPKANTLEELHIAWLQLGENIAVGSSMVENELYICTDELWEHLIEASNGFGVEWPPKTKDEKLEICRLIEHEKFLLEYEDD